MYCQKSDIRKSSALAELFPLSISIQIKIGFITPIQPDLYTNSILTSYLITRTLNTPSIAFNFATASSVIGLSISISEYA